MYFRSFYLIKLKILLQDSYIAFIIKWQDYPFVKGSVEV
ncbi:hypothetical protein KIS4809_2538 [Bacillus sp. ZZV12-4809]|nr:hypothetical protein KIS4809_2538 [Bacillus sp. ZZV12-4809]